MVRWAARYHARDGVTTRQGVERVLARLAPLNGDGRGRGVDAAAAGAGPGGGAARRGSAGILADAITAGTLDVQAFRRWAAADDKEVLTATSAGSVNNAAAAADDDAEDDGGDSDTRIVVTLDGTRPAEGKSDAQPDGHGRGRTAAARLRWSVPRAERPQLDADALLRLACARGDTTMASRALARGAKVNGCRGRACGGPFDPPLNLAAACNHVALVSFLLSRGARAKRPDLLGVFPIVLAARLGHDELCNVLLRQGKVRASRRSTCGATPLALAARAGHLAVVKTLLKGGAGLECQTVDGQDALFNASRHGHVEIAKLLLSRGVDQTCALREQRAADLLAGGGGGSDGGGGCGNIQEGRRRPIGRLPLHEACAGGDASIVREVVRLTEADDSEKGHLLRDSSLREHMVAWPRFDGAGGLPPLCLAARGGHAKVVQALFATLPEGLLPECLSRTCAARRRTPLHWAAAEGHLAVARLLLAKAASVRRAALAAAAAEALANGAAVPARKAEGKNGGEGGEGDSGGGSVGRPGTAARKKKAADDKEVAACVAALVGQKDADGCNCVVVASAEGHREMVRLLDQFL